MAFWRLLNKILAVVKPLDVRTRLMWTLYWNREEEKNLWINRCKLLGGFDAWYRLVSFTIQITCVRNNRDEFDTKKTCLSDDDFCFFNYKYVELQVYLRVFLQVQVTEKRKNSFLKTGFIFCDIWKPTII